MPGQGRADRGESKDTYRGRDTQADTKKEEAQRERERERERETETETERETDRQTDWGEGFIYINTIQKKERRVWKSR